MGENYGCFTFILAIVVMLFIIAGFNSCSSDTWNNGECPKCEARYELRAVTRGYLKYYACPDCGQEVKRY